MLKIIAIYHLLILFSVVRRSVFLNDGCSGHWFRSRFTIYSQHYPVGRFPSCAHHLHVRNSVYSRFSRWPCIRYTGK